MAASTTLRSRESYLLDAHSLRYEDRGPSEAGALSATFAVCSCGWEAGWSLGLRGAQQLGREHAAYWQRQAQSSRKARR